MRDPVVAAKFDYTILSIYPDLNGEQQKQIEGLDLNEPIAKSGHGFDANRRWQIEDIPIQALQERLDKNIPTLFFAWEPHPIMERYKIGRVNLPPFNDTQLFDEGKTDWATDILLKLVSPNLFSLAPDVHQALNRFSLTNAQQQQIMAQVDPQSVFQAVCGWLRSNTDLHSSKADPGLSTSPNKGNKTTFDWHERWVKRDFECDPGSFVVENNSKCTECAAGHYSFAKDSSTACDRCEPGRYKRMHLHW